MAAEMGYASFAQALCPGQSREISLDHQPGTSVNAHCRYPRPEKAGWRIRVGVCVAIILASAPISANGIWPPPKTTQKYVETAVEIFESFRQLLPTPVDGVDGLADQLDYDIEAAITYVRDEVRFEPYQGVLRGPDGTAIAGAGNSWDKALLLASLIKTFGADAQVVLGSLDQASASLLLTQAFNPVQQSRRGFDRKAVVDIVSGHFPQFAQVLDERIAEWEANKEPPLDGDVAAISNTIQALLEESNISLRSRKSVAELIKSLSVDYAWVRWRNGPSSAWVNLHPAFAEGFSPQASARQYLGEEVPPEYQHRVGIRLWIERNDGSGEKPERVPVMNTFERPTAQLFKHPLMLGMAPLSGGDQHSATLLVPLLNDSLAPGAQAVSELGLTVSADAGGSSMASVFVTMASKMGAALGGLSQIDGGEDRKPRLTGVVLTIEQTIPGQEPMIIERRLVDLQPSQGEGFPELAIFDLLFEVDVGAENQSRVLNRQLTQEKALLEAIPAYHAFARNALTREQFQETAQFRALNRSVWLDWDLLSGGLLPKPSATDVRFRTGPVLASKRRITDPKRGLVTITDIHTNPIVVLHRNESGNISIDPHGALNQGVRDTLMESRLLSVAEGWSMRYPNRIVTDSAGLASDKNALTWPEGALEVARADLTNGYVLAITGEEEPHWWRVDPGSGETLGMGQQGGQEIAEYAVLLIMAAVETYIFKKAVEDCDEAYQDNQEMADCCIVGNLITTYGSAAAGSAFGAAGAASGQSLGDLMATSFVEAPWAAALGYITIQLSFAVPQSIIVDEVTQGPIESVCRAYLEQ